MAINKKLIHFKNFSDFNSKKLSANEENTQYTLGVNGEVQTGYPDILYQSICWIKDTKQQWTHGQLYTNGSGSKEPANYQIWYTTTDASVIEFDDTLFDVQLVSNVYENGRGVITFNGDVLSIPAMAFGGKNNLKTIIIPNSVTSIGDNAFNFCTSLTSVTIPDSVTTIGESAFSDCQSLTSITIPNSVTTIGVGAFFNCDSLTSVTIPDSVTTIGVRAFYLCDSLTSVYCKPVTPPTLGGTTIFDNSTNLKIYVPIESLETYKSEQGWDVYSDNICSILDSNSVKTINGESIVGSGDITIDTSNFATKTELAQKQDTLVSGTNIKTINGTSILGSGDLTISGGTSNTMTFVSPTSAATPIPMNTMTVVTSVTSASKTFTLVTSGVVTNPANLRTEQKWSLIFGISASLSGVPTITFNTGNISTLYWVNGAAPTFEVGKYYEVSFLNVGGVLLGVCGTFSASE